MNKPEYIFLDLDDTLYNYKKAHLPAYSKMIEQLSRELDLSIPEVELAFSESKSEVKNRLGATSSSHSRLLYLAELLKKFQLANKLEIAMNLENFYWRTFLMNAELYAGVIEFLTTVRLHGSKIVIVTDLQNSIQYRKLNWFGIAPLIDLVVTSEEAGGDKNSGRPEAYLASLLDSISPAGWCVGDMPWDHLFEKSTKFFQFDESSPDLASFETGGKFRNFNFITNIYESYQ